MTDEKRFTAEEFEVFKTEFIRWQVKLGLLGYKVYFKHEKIDDAFADICTNQGSMVATVRLNSDLQAQDVAFADPKVHAKHEALHLLVARLEMNGRARYIASDEIYEAVEELVRRIEVLIEKEE